MNLKTKTILAAALALPLSATTAFAQPPCGERDAIIKRLEAKWGETMVGGGIQSATNLIEIWTSSDGATWTILKTDANGMACVMATGTDWYAGGLGQQVAGIQG